MPTPMPIIETRIGVIVLKSVRFASRKSRPNAVPTESSAKTIGTLAATSAAEDEDQHEQRDRERR